MGFDIECIIDINTYPGEYFCPVCRTLVYPNEALQSQCTHLYCKPCFSHISNGSRACPYDGYLVTESDSKPLMETDKALAENIGKVKVHCLYFRSGCTWEGTLSDCISHCAGCSFGNSPVICNRCGVQIVHRQVHEHAQSCSGVYDAKQAAGAVSNSTISSAGVPTAEVNQTVAQSGSQVSQAMTAQTAGGNLLPVQYPNQQVPAPLQAPVFATAVPTPEQWYQQQYQQYYQQYGVYDSSQQHNLQYYPLQQQPYQQYQQNQVQGQGPPQPHLHPQPSSVPQTLQQPTLQSQYQGPTQLQDKGQDQPQLQLQPPLVPQPQPQLQVAAQGQAPVHVPFQQSAANYPVNPPQQHNLPTRPPAHMPTQSLPPAPQVQTTVYAQALATRPPSQQPQLPPYHQPNVQIHHTQARQAHIQHQITPQTQPASQALNQPLVQVRPQAHPTQAQPHLPPPNHPPGPTAVPQVAHPPIPPVSGYQTYQQSQPTPPMQSGLSHQLPMHPYPASGPVQPDQVHGQVPQHPAVLQPPHSMPPPPLAASLPLQNQVIGAPPVQHQQLPPHPHQPTYALQHRPALQPAQHVVPQQYISQQPFPAPFEGQMHQQGHFPQQQPVRPYAAPPQPLQSQNYASRPLMVNSGIQLQVNQPSYGAMAPAPSLEPSHLVSKPAPTSQNYVQSAVLEQNSTEQEIRSPSKGLAEKGSEGETSKVEAAAGQPKTLSDKSEITATNRLVKAFKQDEVGMEHPLGQTSGKPLEVGCKEFTDADSLKRVNFENQDLQMAKAVVAGSSSSSFSMQPKVGISTSGVDEHLRSPHSHGSHPHRPQEQVPPQPPSLLGPQGPGILPHPLQSFNPLEGSESGVYGTAGQSFESQSAPLGPQQAGLAAPQLRHESQFGAYNVARPSDSVMIRDQRSIDGGLFRQTYSSEPSFPRNNGDSALNSTMFGSKDERLKTLVQGHLHPSMVERNRLFDHGSMDKAPLGPTYHAEFDRDALGRQSRFLASHRPTGDGPGNNFGVAPEFGPSHTRHFAPPSPDGEYRGFGGSSGFPLEKRFGDVSRSFNPSSDLDGNPFRDSRFPHMPGHFRRGDVDGSDNHRFGEHMVPGPNHSHIKNNDVFGQDGPGHLMRGEFPGPGYLPGHFNMTETTGPGAFPSHARVTEFGGPGNFPVTRSNYSHQGFNAGSFPSGVDSFDQSRRKRPVSTGWCRICKLDCETVEGLDLHSQTREHQKASLDMVKMIKQQNRKKKRTSGGQFMRDGGRAKKMGLDNRGNAP